MSVNSFREDEEQKQSIKLDVIVRLLKYLLDYKKTIAAVLLIMAVTTAITLVNPLLVERALDVEVLNKEFAIEIEQGEIRCL